MNWLKIIFDFISKILTNQSMQKIEPKPETKKVERVIEPKVDEMKIGIPINGKYKITSGFGVPRGDIAHPGIDFVGIDDIGNMICVDTIAAMDGVVEWCQNTGSAGNAVCISRIILDTEPAQKLVVTYMHLENIDQNLMIGKAILKGDRIGLMGNTGASEGAHLHLQCNIQSISTPYPWNGPGGTLSGQIVDPMKYLDIVNG